MSSYDEMRVALFGVPRSGTSWIGEILNSSPATRYKYQPLFSYAMRDFLTPSSRTTEIDEFFAKLATIEDEFIDRTQQRATGAYPKFDKDLPTHTVFKEVRYINILFNLMRRTEDLRLCAVIRNPLSVINSWLRAPREFRADLGWSELEEWRYAIKKNMNKPEEFNGYEKWKEAANIFHTLAESYPERVYLIRYGELLQDPQNFVDNWFEWLNLGVSDQTRSFLQTSQNSPNNNAYSVFRTGQSDEKWRDELNPLIIEQVRQDLAGTRLEVYLK